MKNILYISFFLLMSFSSDKPFFLKNQYNQNLLVVTDKNDTFFTKENNILILDVFSQKIPHNQSFDTIGCFQDNLWSSNTFYPFEEIIKSLKKDNQAIFSFIPKDSCHFLLIDTIIQKERWKKYLKNSYYENARSIEDFLNYLKNFNVEIQKFQIQKDFLIYNDLIQFKDSIRQNFNFLIDLPEDLQEDFLNEISELAANKCLHKNKIIIPYKSINIYIKT